MYCKAASATQLVLPAAYFHDLLLCFLQGAVPHGEVLQTSTGSDMLSLSMRTLLFSPAYC